MLKESQQIIEILSNVPEGNRETVLREVFQTVAKKVKQRRPAANIVPAGMPARPMPPAAGPGLRPPMPGPTGLPGM